MSKKIVVEPKKPTNKLSIYLIKGRHTEVNDILKDIDSYKKVDINQVGTLYYDDSHVNPPGWASTFFQDKISELNIFNAGSKAILLVRLDIDSDKKMFAIPFGFGWTMLNAGVWEERFGLKVALNSINTDGLRKISKKNISSVPKDSSEQLGKAGQTSDFGIDIEQDLIQSVTALSTNPYLGKTITGRDPLSVSVRVDLSNIKDFLQKVYQCYSLDSYKENFGWIDQIANIKDQSLAAELDGKMLEKIHGSDFSGLWMAVPELIEWERIKGFRYIGPRRDTELHDDLHLPDYLDVALDGRDRLDVQLEDFEKHITALNVENDNDAHRWKAYNCLYCEITNNGNTYLLSNGKWYQIAGDFAAQVNNDFTTLRSKGASVSLPEYSHNDEAAYNEAAAKSANLICMDRKNIRYGGGYSAIEFCDLLGDKQLIHVKRYGGSSVLSHLFFQGVVSGELFLGDTEFRKKLNNKLPDGSKLEDPTQKPNAADYTIVFAVVSNSKHDLELPFFSKVSLRNAKRRLETFGYRVEILKIRTTAE